MTKPMASIVCAVFAFLTMIAGFFLTGVPIVGAVMAFASPALGLAGIVLGGLGLSEAKNKGGEGEGAATTGLVISIIAFILGLVVALTCGLCNACMTASMGAGGAAAGGAMGGLQQLAEEAQRAAEAQRVQEAEVVSDLNEICPDSWCEGEWSYSFTSFHCPAVGDCNLSATVTSNDNPGAPRFITLVIPRHATGFGNAGQPRGPFDMDAVSTVINNWEATANIAPPSGVAPSGGTPGAPGAAPGALPAPPP